MNGSREDTHVVEGYTTYDFRGYVCVIEESITRALDRLYSAMQAPKAKTSLRQVEAALQDLSLVQHWFEEIVSVLERDIDYYRSEFAWQTLVFRPRSMDEQTLFVPISRLAFKQSPQVVFQSYRELLQTILDGLGEFIETLTGSEVKYSEDTEGMFIRPSPLSSSRDDDDPPIEDREQITLKESSQGLALLVRIVMQDRPDRYATCVGFLAGALQALSREFHIVAAIWQCNQA